MNNILCVLTRIKKLPNLGVNPQNINFSSVSVESDKYITVRDNVSAQKTITIIETATQQITSNKSAADSAIMNPNSKILALRGMLVVVVFYMF